MQPPEYTNGCGLRRRHLDAAQSGLQGKAMASASAEASARGRATNSGICRDGLPLLSDNRTFAQEKLDLLNESREEILFLKTCGDIFSAVYRTVPSHDDHWRI